MAAIEPLTGRRLAHVRERRTMKEFTAFRQELAQTYPEATKIRLVLDNLNTHRASAFYTHLPADEAFALAQRFEFYYTPKVASWLNMIEIEFSALARLCLNRRIPSISRLEQQVIPFFADRTEKKIKINWLFSVDDCRQRLNKKYRAVNGSNDKFKNV